MGRAPADSFWYNPKVKQAFLFLCEKSFKPSPRWGAFRELDKKSIFGGYSNAQLSMKFRKFWLIKNGLCYYCGKEPYVSENNYLCQTCNDKIRDMPSNVAKRTGEKKKRKKKNAK